jgi:hypothetical protein
MNFTVGPLPPAVYWRRRAIVAVGLLLVVLLIVYACSGPSTSSASLAPSPTPTQALSPSLDGLASAAGAPAISASPSLFISPLTSPTPSAHPSPSPRPTQTGIPTCSDAQIEVTPVISSTSGSTTRLVHGGTFDLKLKVRNVSKVTCRRDVGGAPEELRIMSGKTKIWSSDDCVRAQGKAHDVRTFRPGIGVYAEVAWSSYKITTHTCTKSPTPAKIGTYQLIGRVGAKKATTPFKIVS